MIELGDLEFTANDFEEYCIKNPGAPHSECTAEHVNRILREKLAKAPEVFGKVAPMGMGSAWSSLGLAAYNDTHRARLVCMEKLK